MIDQLIAQISPENITDYFRRKLPSFKPVTENLDHILSEKDFDQFSSLLKHGEVTYGNSDELMVFSCRYTGELTSRSSKHKQYDIAKKVLKEERMDAAIFIFFDETGKFRFSLIRTLYNGTRRDWTAWKRYTYFVDPQKPNKTFRNQIDKCSFDSLENILKAFSIEAVTDDFYNTFNPTFDKIANRVVGDIPFSLKQDFALLFVIRSIFIGFVQKRKWLADDEAFLQNFWNEYKQQHFGENQFYAGWLEPLFFEALNSPPGREVEYRNNDFSNDTRLALKMAPFLNGELFKRKTGYDNLDLYIPDQIIGEFFDFLFQFNFTVEENTRYDEDLELNPEFLGIIFERLVNKKDGAVYTPRTEVDFMCRIALVKWLQKVSSCNTRDLYYLFFREMGNGNEFEDYQKEGDFSRKELEELIGLLKNISTCDPASGSGAFPVGMMQVLNEILTNLQSREKTPEHLRNEDDFDRKKAIIANSLYGVEVKRWAVWINQLRLWLSLFVDIPAERDSEFRYSPLPLLPYLDFKIRQGDSLVQRIGNKLFPVQGHANIQGAAMKAQITALKKAKIEFFYNRSGNHDEIRKRESAIFRAIIDEQIDEKRKEVLRLSRQPEAEQTSMFADPSPKQTNLNLYKDQIEQLEKEIESLREERAAFKEEHPLIWNIEFAEIFYDRGGFDIIIGNPPYVRQEDIADPEGKVEKATDYKRLLHETIRAEYPKHFVAKEKIDGKSDLYTFFYLKSLRLLNENGVHTFICSNSWLDVGYGAWMQKFLLNHCRVHFVIDNHARRSFATADVNTIISVIDAPVKAKKELDPSFGYKFVAFKRPFDEVLFTENLLQIEEQKTEILKTADYRSYPVSIEKLLEEGSDFETEQQRKLKAGEYIGDKWGGKYLRAPDLFFDLLSKEEIIVPFGLFAKVETVSWSRIGLNTEIIQPKGYIQQKNNIVEISLLKSPKDFQSVFISKSDLKFILIYDKRIEGKVKTAEIFWDDLRDKKHRCIVADSEIAYSHAFHGIVPRNTSEKLIIGAILNSTLNHFFTEIYSRTSLGGGAARILVNELRLKFKTINPKIFGLSERSYLEKIFRKLSNRNIHDIFIECGLDPESSIPLAEQEPNPLPDRKELDDVVFDALGLSDEERKEVYRAVCQLVWNRISKAKSV
ncbi:MAG: Eco57I restriction-modification methylase domain-containing protein [Prolixibacteraceae bacterium]|nr:Eco57I restriction-modification methylase domain-containing protein [Prolixibacteraceae bacterium]